MATSLLPSESVLQDILHNPKGEHVASKLQGVLHSVHEGATKHGSALHEHCQRLTRQLAALHGMVAPGFGSEDCDQWGMRVELWIMELQSALDRLAKADDDFALRQLLHTAQGHLHPLIDAMSESQSDHGKESSGDMSSCSSSTCGSSVASSAANSSSSSQQGRRLVAMRSRLSYNRHWAGKVCV